MPLSHALGDEPLGHTTNLLSSGWNNHDRIKTQASPPKGPKNPYHGSPKVFHAKYLPVTSVTQSNQTCLLLLPSPRFFEVAIFGCFGLSIDVFPSFSYSYSAVAVLVLVLEVRASSTSTISLSTSTIKDKTRNSNAALGRG